MFIELQVNPLDRARIERQLAELGARAKTVAARVLNRAIERARGRTAKMLAAEIGVAAKDLTSPHRFGARGRQSTGIAIRADKASESKLTARLWVSGRRIPAIFLKGKSRSLFPADDRATGLVKIPRKVVRTRDGRVIAVTRGAKGGATWRGEHGTVSGANVFRARMRSGHTGLFVRSAGNLSKIWEVTGVSVPYASRKNNRVVGLLKQDIGPFMVKRLAQELARRDTRRA